MRTTKFKTLPDTRTIQADASEVVYDATYPAVAATIFSGADMPAGSVRGGYDGMVVIRGGRSSQDGWTGGPVVLRVPDGNNVTGYNADFIWDGYVLNAKNGEGPFDTNLTLLGNGRITMAQNFSPTGRNLAETPGFSDFVSSALLPLSWRVTVPSDNYYINPDGGFVVNNVIVLAAAPRSVAYMRDMQRANVNGSGANGAFEAQAMVFITVRGSNAITFKHMSTLMGGGQTAFQCSTGADIVASPGAVLVAWKDGNYYRLREL